MGMQIDSKVLSQKQATIQAALDAKKGTPSYDISIFRDDVLNYGTKQQKEAYKKLTGWTKEAAEADKLRRWANIGKNKGKKSGVIEADRRAAEFLKSNTATDAVKVNDPIVLDEAKKNYKDAIGKILKRRPEVNAETINKMHGIGETNETLDAMGDYYRLLEEQGNKGNKFLDFFKNNKKALLIGAGILAVAGLATWAISKYNKNKAEEEVAAANAAAVPPEADVNNKVEATVPPVFPGTIPPENDIVVPYAPGMQPGAEDETTPEGEDGTVPEAVVPTTPEGKDVEKEEDTDNVSDAEKQVKPSEVATKEYVVKPGDNVWNIAKKQLTEELGRKPYNREIAVRTKQILEKNNLKYEADNYTVLIYPGGKLDIAS